MVAWYQKTKEYSVRLKNRRLLIKIFKVWKFANFGELRSELYYFFGLLCLLSWLAFNLWILRDYFFPWWFSPLYTESGLPKHKLEMKKRKILLEKRVIDDVKILPDSHTIFLHDSSSENQNISVGGHNNSNSNIILKKNDVLNSDKIYYCNTNKELQNNIKNSVIIEM